MPISAQTICFFFFESEKKKYCEIIMKMIITCLEMRISTEFSDIWLALESK